MKIETVKISTLKLNPANPRTIKDEKFAQLVRSVRDFPQMLGIRPIVVNKKMEVLGGNMRIRACIEAGLLDVPIIRAESLTDDQQREFIIKDNVGFGEWDWGAALFNVQHGRQSGGRMGQEKGIPRRAGKADP